MKCLVAILLSLNAFAAADEVVDRFVAHVRAHPDGKAAHSIETAPYAGDLNRLPIGVFDSGIGGLTVLEAILGLDAFNNETLQPGGDGVPDFANERFIYFGDQANMPYGNYPHAGKTDFLRELALKDAAFLLGKRYSADALVHFDKPPVKAIVIACNTATAYAIDDARAAVKDLGLPVIVVGVVEAGARGVRETAKTGLGIGVLATAGTCSSGTYPKMITSSLGLAGKSVPVIIQQGGVNFAAAIEGDPAFKGTVADEALAEVRKLLDTQRQTPLAKPLGTVVLGCTHYPLALSEIKTAFEAFRRDPSYAALLAPEITFVDPASWTARELFRELAKARLRMKQGESCVMPHHAFYISTANTDFADVKLSPDGGLETTYKYGRQAGHLDLEDTLAVPMTLERIPEAGRHLVETKLPLVSAALQATANR